MSSLPAKIVAVHRALFDAQLPHAFGGALALAWCTGRARGTIDVDVNIFVTAEQADVVLQSLPAPVTHTPQDVAQLVKDGQARFWWQHTPLDVFLNTTDFHEQAAQRVRWETFMDAQIPFLACNDLAVFKAFFNRPKDWVDLAEMHAAGTLDGERVAAILIRYLGADDERVAQVLQISSA